MAPSKSKAHSPAVVARKPPTRVTKNVPGNITSNLPKAIKPLPTLPNELTRDILKFALEDDCDALQKDWNRQYWASSSKTNIKKLALVSRTFFQEVSAIVSEKGEYNNDVPYIQKRDETHAATCDGTELVWQKVGKEDVRFQPARFGISYNDVEKVSKQADQGRMFKGWRACRACALSTKLQYPNLSYDRVIGKSHLWWVEKALKVAGKKTGLLKS